MKNKITLYLLQCKRCGNKFYSFKGYNLKSCQNPKCRSKYWNKDKVLHYTHWKHKRENNKKKYER